jgi:hypothetical protein
MKTTIIPLTVHVYWFKGRIYVPVISLADAGFFSETPPVASVSISAPDLRAVIADRLEGGNPRVPTPDPRALPHVYRAAGARTSLEFDRRATLWSIEADDRELRLKTHERFPRGGWGGPISTRVFPRSAEGLDGVVAGILDGIAPEERGGS